MKSDETLRVSFTFWPKKKKGERERGSKLRMITVETASQAIKEGKVAAATIATIKPRRTHYHSISFGIIFFRKNEIINYFYGMD